MGDGYKEYEKDFASAVKSLNNIVEDPTIDKWLGTLRAADPQFSHTNARTMAAAFLFVQSKMNRKTLDQLASALGKGGTPKLDIIRYSRKIRG